MELFVKLLETLGPYALGLMGLISGIWSIVAKSKRDKADISKVVSEVAQDWIEVLKVEVEELKLANKKLEARISDQASEMIAQNAKMREQEGTIKSQQEQLNVLSARADSQAGILQEFCEGAEALHMQVKDLGATPVWEPPLVD